ncbi:MAG TPA: tetratricopeptide repeat protein [Rubrivivax sp.]|nr:tetratricopeptide repeat protein [Rubrivivax sp.]
METDDFARARASFLDGVAHFEVQQFDAAERCFVAALQHLPGRASTRINLAATRLALRRPAEALAELEAVLADEPQHLDAWCHRAAALAELGRDADALACADHVLAHDAQQPQAWYRRGLALERLRRFDEAGAAFERLLALQPQHVEAWFRLGQMLQRQGRLEAALACQDKVVALAPAHAAAWSQRGSLLEALGRRDDAVAAYEQAMALGADAELHRFHIASLRGGSGAGSPPAPPRAYVQGLFDDYADGFDQHLVGVLGYRGHRQLVAPLPALQPGGFAAALDLGCGTGLCGPLLRPMVRRLDGVDLSPAMLERAAALGVYDQLHCAELAEHLAHSGARYDLVLAADVFIYVGELQAVFAGVMRVLQPGGLLCFTVEQADDARQVVLSAQRRYAHSLPYLRTLAQRHGLQLLQALQQPIRQQQQQAVGALYVVLRRP